MNGLHRNDVGIIQYDKVSVWALLSIVSDHDTCVDRQIVKLGFDYKDSLRESIDRSYNRCRLWWERHGCRYNLSIGRVVSPLNRMLLNVIDDLSPFLSDVRLFSFSTSLVAIRSVVSFLAAVIARFVDVGALIGVVS